MTTLQQQKNFKNLVNSGALCEALKNYVENPKHTKNNRYQDI